MGITGIRINGIDVSYEHGHYLLQRNNIKMRCDIGELNEGIEEFEEYWADKNRKKVQVG